MIMPGGDEVIQIFRTQLMKIVRDYFLCFLMMLSWAPGMAQQGSHLFSLMASCRDTPGLKEVRLLQDGRESGRRQCTPEGVTSFYYQAAVHKPNEFEARYFIRKGDTVTVFLATSGSGFMVNRNISTDYSVKDFINANPAPHPDDYGRNSYLKQVKHIKDSSAMLQHKQIIRLRKERPRLVSSRIKNKSSKVDSVQTEREKRESGYYLSMPSAGVENEYQDGLLIRRTRKGFEDVFGYNKDRKRIEHHTFVNGKLHYTTVFKYVNGTLESREFQDMRNHKTTRWTFRYQENGLYEKIEKTTGKKTTVYTFEYSYW